MKLHHLKATNVLSFGHEGVELEFASFNVIAGPNDSGKTNLFRALRLIEKAFDYGKPPLDEILFQGDSDRSLHLEVGVELDDTELELLATLIICSEMARIQQAEDTTQGIKEYKLWNWDAYYAIGCPYCDVRHPALDRLEFEGQHPWQLHPEMLRRSVGLSNENDTKSYGVTRRFLPEGDAVSDKTVGKAWDRGADLWYSRYTDFGDLNRQYVIDPAILRILGRVEGKRILDAGCGNGYLCRLLSKKGAEMVGVDVSKRSIEIAEDIEKNESMNIEYHVGSVCNLSMCSDATFDAVVSNLVLQDLQNIDKAVEELHRVLRPEGKLVFSIMHPCFSSAPVHGWVRKPIDSSRKEDRLYWKVDRYFDRNIEEWTYFGLPPVYSFHRPLSDYMKVLMKIGFAIADFQEPVPTAKDMEEHYKEFGNEYDRIPWFLIIGATNRGKK